MFFQLACAIIKHKEESVEFKKHFDWRYVFVGLYVLAFAIYIIVGLQPAKATEYEKNGEIVIPSINLESDTVKLNLVGRKLETPDTLVGSFAQNENKTLLIGHSTTVFSNLGQIKLKDRIIYNGRDYFVRKIQTWKKELIDMGRLLRPEEKDTIVLMTCAGVLLGEGDATHRLIITASVQ